jgi:hypothetical protein
MAPFLRLSRPASWHINAVGGRPPHLLEFRSGHMLGGHGPDNSGGGALKIRPLRLPLFRAVVYHLS